MKLAPQISLRHSRRMRARLSRWLGNAMYGTVRYSIVDKDTHVGEKLSDRSGWEEGQRD